MVDGEGSRMKYISLFAGIGGFDLGFDRAGMKCVAQVEIDLRCLSVLRRHKPDVPKWADIRAVKGDELPYADVICGGFPCQDLSVAVRRAGLNGARSSLFYEMLRIIYESRPAFAVWENVPGLLSSCSCRKCRRQCKRCGTLAGADDDVCEFCGGDEFEGRVLPEHRGADFFAVVSSFGFVGYCGAWTMLDAQFFGLAQRRRRLFGVFARSDIGAERCAEILSLASRLPGHIAPSREAQQVASSLLASDAGTSRPGGGGGEIGFLVWDNAQISSKANGSNPKPGQPSPPLNTSMQMLVANTLGAHHEHNDPEIDTLIAFDYAVQGSKRTFIHRKNGYAQLQTRPDAIANSDGIRRLTPRECERLQGFPDDWTRWGDDEREISDSARYRMLGNA